MKKNLQMQRRPSSQSMSLGMGHGGNSNLPSIMAHEWLPKDYPVQAGTRTYRMGNVSIMVSPPTAGIGWMMSIAHPKRYPTWDEVAKARYELLPQEAYFAMILPPPSDYINLHNFCFLIHECVNPPNDLVSFPAAIEGVKQKSLKRG